MRTVRSSAHVAKVLLGVLLPPGVVVRVLGPSVVASVLLPSVAMYVLLPSVGVRVLGSITRVVVPPVEQLLGPPVLRIFQSTDVTAVV